MRDIDAVAMLRRPNDWSDQFADLEEALAEYGYTVGSGEALEAYGCTFDAWYTNWWYGDGWKIYENDDSRLELDGHCMPPTDLVLGGRILHIDCKVQFDPSDGNWEKDALPALSQPFARFSRFAAVAPFEEPDKTQTMILSYGDKLNEADLPVPVREGYTFGGWYISEEVDMRPDEDDKGGPVNEDKEDARGPRFLRAMTERFGTQIVTSNMRLTALWIPCKNGHSWGKWTQTKAPSITAAGEETRICIMCSKKETRAISALGKQNQTAPRKPVLASRTHNSVTLKTVSGIEYSKDGTTWQTSSVFKGLKKNKKYSFYARKKAAATHNASPKSAKLTVTTLKGATPNIKASAVPESKTAKKGYKVTLEAPNGTTLYYTTNKKAPTVKTKTKVTKKKTLTIKKNTTLRVIAVKKGYTPSKEVKRVYQVK